MTDHDIVMFQLATARSLGSIQSSIEKIDRHFEVMNGTVLRHAQDIADIRSGLATAKARAAQNRRWISALCAIAGVILGVVGKIAAAVVFR